MHSEYIVYTAQTYGRVIISELSVPIQNKTIKPTSIGGAAGGEKYIVNGILFKFALDFNGIYGGDENAAKAAGHDLKVRREPKSKLTSTESKFINLWIIIMINNDCII